MDNLNFNISVNLKKLRKERAWSLDKTSQKTNVSKSMLGQIERGESIPTIATLWKIAKGFNIAFSYLMQNELCNFDYQQPQVKKPDQQNNKIEIINISPFNKQTGIEIFLLSLPPFYTHLSPPHQKGVIEYVLSIDNVIEVLKNDKWNKVNQYNSISFPADISHGYRNLSDKPALFHNIIHYQKN